MQEIITKTNYNETINISTLGHSISSLSLEQPYHAFFAYVHAHAETSIKFRTEIRSFEHSREIIISDIIQNE
jgi:hypothetical protein